MVSFYLKDQYKFKKIAEWIITPFQAEFVFKQ